MRLRIALAAVVLLTTAAEAAVPAVHPLAPPLCASLSRSVESLGNGPVFVTSYRPLETEHGLPLPLSTTAFVYDNALAAIALIACGHTAEATQIGRAIAEGIDRDRRFRDGRIRNAYRAGRVPDGPLLLPGWWDTSNQLWAEDAYQDGTATGNVAWAALALLNVHAATGEAWALDGAERLASWMSSVAGGPGPAGFTGGLHGFDDAQVRVPWKSTEHHADIAAVAHWLHRLTGKQVYADMEATARGFLVRMFDQEAGGFRIGTLPDGSLSPIERIAMDAQVWPLIAVSDAPAGWRRALDLIDTRLAVPGGYDFNGDRDGLWAEGTAQAALVQKAMGRASPADRLLDSLAQLQSSDGWLRATNVPRLTTGLAIGPDSKGDDFFYYPRPHLGATAWAVLAAEGWNPFTGGRVE
jgi:hypothetical protein